MIHTHFCKCNVAFYKRFLIDCYKKVSEHVDYTLEHSFYDSLRGQDIATFSLEPEIVGWCAGKRCLYSGRDYPQEVKDMALSFTKKDGALLSHRMQHSSTSSQKLDIAHAK